MTYKAIFTDEFLSYFRLDDNGKTLVLTDITGNTRAVVLEEEKQGKWIECFTLDKNNECLDNSIYFKCSSYKGLFRKTYNYCPNCGAKMTIKE